MTSAAPIPIIIVSYRNARDVVECLGGLQSLVEDPPIEIYICANGGATAFDTLLSSLVSPDGPCDYDDDTRSCKESPQFVRVRLLRLRKRGTRVELAEAAENLGYGGAINAWLRVLLTGARWPGAWLLNPDTRPDPNALAELVAWSKARGKGMIGSRIIDNAQPGIVQTRGLRWRRMRASTEGIDKYAPTGIEPDPSLLEARIDAPSGVSIYVTRGCLQRVGLMDERYFLFFEDLDWGQRAKSSCGLGYAHKSIVVHKGGTTIGSGTSRATASTLAVYLEFRNRIIFVRQHYPSWIFWTYFVLFFRCFEYCLVGAFTNMRAALLGLRAGAADETGRPDCLFDFSPGIPSLRTAPSSTDANLLRRFLYEQRGVNSGRRTAKQRTKIAISLAYYISVRTVGLLRRLVGRPGAHRLVILYYHTVPAAHRANFCRQLDILSSRVPVIRADYYGTANPDGHSVAITFDDALTDALDYAIPELGRRGMPSTIFVPVGRLGGPVDWEIEHGFGQDAGSVATRDALQDLKAELVQLGSHSLTHPHLSRIPREQARREIIESRAQMLELFGIDISTFAFPYGDCDAETIEFCREAGYQRVFSNLPHTVDPTSDEFVRGRVSVDADDGLLEFYLKMSGAFEWMAYVSTLKRWFGTRARRPSSIFVLLAKK